MEHEPEDPVPQISTSDQTHATDGIAERDRTVIDLTDLIDSPPSNSSNRKRSNPHSSQNTRFLKKNFKSDPDCSDEIQVMSQSRSNSRSSSQLRSSPDQKSRVESVKLSAVMVESVVIDLEDELSCPICCELFIAPVNFSCGHSFCGCCAQQWLEKENVCPTCRQEPSSSPSRVYALESILHKYFQHQLDTLRKAGEDSKALALELERQEKLDDWNLRRKRLESSNINSIRSSSIRSYYPTTSQSQALRPVNLPQITALELHNYHHNMLPFENRAPQLVPPVSNLFRVNRHSSNHSNQYHHPRSTSLRIQRADQASNRIPSYFQQHSNGSSSSSSRNLNNPAQSGSSSSNGQRGGRNNVAERGWDRNILNEYFARS
ncbi:hypothetical protein BY996DRAFT_6421309 [Phakopsora pachyrhizi]|uniref:Expressed protein n=1 Tax=Phakopsora pachyrhizi TaxID=170000 RepID=A0AAV0BCV7_PHAPC|nr:hypothetical protein BY996DRAFT_8538674 [Phakopsora pachyrhizi]KAI8442872.1 hypothetical protein BY996DRAFT_6428656 [Phakopsora pachyrhizi]KAI8447249.1 hypothetical protein BY996DRAFT_6421309 [Phakopsora pachyrhizi]CAH7684106.1 expressed protein [Phakopsora pachyrhizi]CAH7684212.1 expressed protein [Phakopsora pachyrhizi]